MKKFFGEFKKFIARGNVMDLAVAVIIGGAFGKITTSLVNDIIMPLISAVFGLFGLKGGVEGMSLVLNGVPKYVTDAATNTQVLNSEAILWNYGNFIQTILDFLIIAFIVFCLIKGLNAANKELGDLFNPKSPFTKQERKQLRKQGKTRKEIAELENAKTAELKKLEEEAAAEAAKNAPPTTDQLLTEIRDLLKRLEQTDKE